MQVASNSSSKRSTPAHGFDPRNTKRRRSRDLCYRCITESLEHRWLLSGGPDKLINNNNGGAAGQWFTQSETTIVQFGNNIVAGFNDSGANSAGNKFTGWAFSSDNGNTWTDGGNLPGNNDAGDPSLARDNVTGRIYYATLFFTGAGIDVFRSDTNGASWLVQVNGAPGKSGTQDKEWITVDNAPGAGQGNVYLVERDFGAGNNIFFFKSTDQGATFGPNGGLAMNVGSQGAFVATGPNHEIYVFGYNGSSLLMKKSTDFGASFGAAVTVATGLVGGTNGDLFLTGQRNGTGTFNSFRSNEFPHAAVNPVNGNIYVVYDNDGAGVDKADAFLVQSTNGGASFGAPIKVNDDATTTDQWFPTVSVTPDGTHLGVFYYSRQEDTASNNSFKYYGRIATISGASINFTPSEAISDVASLPEFGRDAVVNSIYMGDYNYSAASNTAFHVVWSDNRSDYAAGPPRKDPNVYYDQIPITVGPNGIWDGGGDGVNWTDPNNWSNNVLPTSVDDAIINVAGVQNIVLASGAQSVKSLTCAENLTISGGSLSLAQTSSISGSFTLSGGTLTGAGNFTLTGSTNTWSAGTMTGTGQTIIDVGDTLNVTSAGTTSGTRPVSVNGTLSVATGGNKLLILTSISVAGKIDLNDNDMVLDYTGGSQLAAVQALINAARNGGTWNGNGITSTSAATRPAHDTTLGAMEATDFNTVYGVNGTFDGYDPDNDAVLIKYTYYGDTDFNGQVNGADYARIDFTFNQETTTHTDIGGWFNGDADGNGKVDGADYALIDGAFNSQIGILRPANSLPTRGKAGGIGRV